MTKAKQRTLDPGPEKLAELIKQYCLDIRVSPTALFEKCHIQRSEWTRLRQGHGLSLTSLRALSSALSIPLAKLLLVSNYLTPIEVANMQSQMVIDELKIVAPSDDPRQLWRLTRDEGEMLRYWRLLKHKESKDTVRQVIRGQVRLTSHINFDVAPELGEEDETHETSPKN